MAPIFLASDILIFWEFLSTRVSNNAVDFFRGRLDQMMELRLPLLVLMSRMLW